MIVYEKLTNESFAPKGITEIINYFYATVLASDKDLELGYETFLDYLDENPEKLTEFNEWLVSVTERNNRIDGQQKGEEVDPKKS
jgi:hypothetical protein